MPLSFPPFPHNARSDAIGLLFFCFLRATRRVCRANIVPALSLRSAFVATVKLALRGAHLSLIPKADLPTMDHEREREFCIPWFCGDNF